MVRGLTVHQLFRSPLTWRCRCVVWCPFFFGPEDGSIVSHFSLVNNSTNLYLALGKAHERHVNEGGISHVDIKQGMFAER